MLPCPVYVPRSPHDLPDIGAAAVVCEQLSLCSLGSGWLGRAVLQLEPERWYVRTAVPEDGVGCRDDSPEGSLSGVHRDIVMGGRQGCLDTDRRRRVEGWLLHLCISVQCLLLL
jgi:hypothetical protein